MNSKSPPENILISRYDYESPATYSILGENERKMADDKWRLAEVKRKKNIYVYITELSWQ